MSVFGSSHSVPAGSCQSQITAGSMLHLDKWATQSTRRGHMQINRIGFHLAVNVTLALAFIRIVSERIKQLKSDLPNC